MNFFLKILLALLILSFFSCDSSDNDTPEEENEDKLILKKITGGSNGTFVIHFDEKGRLSFSESTRFPTLSRINDVTYNIDGEKEKFTTYNVSGAIDGTIEYFYDSEGKIIRVVQEFENLPYSSPTSTVNLSYQNNIVTSIALQDDVEKYKLIFEFNNNDYEQLEKLEVFDTNNEKVFEEVYEYSNNGNLTKNTIVVGEDQINTSNSFMYDDKRNPYSEGNKQFHLNEILLLDHPNSLAIQLTLSTTNNLLTPLSGEGTMILKYNEKNYIVKETITNNNETVSIRTFEYY